MEETGNGFVSAPIDFWTDSVRRESNSAIVVNMGADRYVLANGQELFMSSQTRNKLNPDLFSTARKPDKRRLSAGDGSNAIGPVCEFELKGRDEGHVNNLDFNICTSHQNERSSGYASGLRSFAENKNEELGDNLKKNPTIQTELNRHRGTDECLC